MSTISLQSVTRNYVKNGPPAVCRISLDVERGQIITLLGPSGCGKTTVLRLIAGFEKPDEGSVWLNGHMVDGTNKHVPPEKRGVGMVFQDYALFPHLTVEKNIGFGYKGKNKKEKVMQLLEMAGLTGLLKRYPHELSGGQKQRVALARALAPDPVVVLLDEPFSSLDMDLRSHMRLEISDMIKKTETTAVFVSHDQSDAMAISDRIAVMHTGNIVQYDTPQRIYQSPKNRFVATFIGRSNILKGTLSSNGNSVHTDIGTIPLSTKTDLSRQKEVTIAIRPESFEKDDAGAIRGVITRVIYTGASLDTWIEAAGKNGKTHHIITHIHPEEHVKIGDHVRFSVLPHFVSIIAQNE